MARYWIKGSTTRLYLGGGGKYPDGGGTLFVVVVLLVVVVVDVVVEVVVVRNCGSAHTSLVTGTLTIFVTRSQVSSGTFLHTISS